MHQYNAGAFHIKKISLNRAKGMHGVEGCRINIVSVIFCNTQKKYSIQILVQPIFYVYSPTPGL